MSTAGAVRGTIQAVGRRGARGTLPTNAIPDPGISPYHASAVGGEGRLDDPGAGE